MNFLYLSKTALFQGSTAEETEKILSCLGAEEKHYRKEEIICHMEDTVTSLGVVISGSVLIENDDIWGNRSILDRVGPGQIFAETYACVPHEPLMVSVVAEQPSSVLFLETPRMLRVCGNGCAFHRQLVENLLMISAGKNLALSRKIACTTAKTIRGRLLTYLSHQAAQHQSSTFSIPFNRQQLADYLNVERSALSNELSKMQRDGLLRVEGRRFSLMVESSDAL